MEKKLYKKEAKKVFLENHKIIRNEKADGFVVLKNINKIYDNQFQAVYDFNLSIQPNEFIVLVGPSGCGKSTTLRMIAGLEDISSGYLYIDHVLANHLESKDRNIAMVFQSYALYPQMSVYDNIAFGLKVQKMPKEEIKNKVYEAASILNLGSLLDRKPKELSGGQMQRVALGRALVRDAKLFLMDEPLSNLDAKLRVHMRSEIVKIHHSVQATTIYVTHDQTEAMTMADRIVVMNKGFIQQSGTPKEIYDQPKNIFVATFIGTPPMNILKLPIKKNKVVSTKHDFTLPENYLLQYETFIRQKIAYFETLKCCVDETAEKQIIALINQYVHHKENTVETILSWLHSLQEQKVLLKEKYTSFLEQIDSVKEDGERLKNVLTEIKKELQKTYLDIENLLKKFDSSCIASITAEKLEEVTQKKRRWFHHDKEVIEKSKEEELTQRIDEYIRKYQDQLQENKTMLIGIRPEDIYLSDESKGTPSDELQATVTLSELMGSEYYVHTEVFDEEIILKLDTNQLLRINDAISFVFNLEKLKIFDPISGENILWKEI